MRGVVLAVEVVRLRLAGGGDHVPAGALAREMVGRGELARHVAGLVVGGGDGADQADALGHRRERRQQRERLEAGDARGAVLRARGRIADAHAVGQEHGVEAGDVPGLRKAQRGIEEAPLDPAAPPPGAPAPGPARPRPGPGPWRQASVVASSAWAAPAGSLRAKASGQRTVAARAGMPNEGIGLCSGGKRMCRIRPARRLAGRRGQRASSAIGSPSRTAAAGAQEGSKRTPADCGNSSTTVDPSRKRPISCPLAMRMSWSS